MLYEIFIIFVCMFACIGITELAIYLFNRMCSPKLPCKFYILADNLENDDAECVIRFLESVISRAGLDRAVCGIKLGENIHIDNDILDTLKHEFGNII